MRVSKKAGATIVKASRTIRSLKAKQKSLRKRAINELKAAKAILSKFKVAIKALDLKYSKQLLEVGKCISLYAATNPNDYPTQTPGNSDALTSDLWELVNEEIVSLNEASFEDLHK